MYLSKTQKEIVIKIAKNEISNIYELLKYYKLITLTKTIDNAGYLIKMYNDSFVIDNPEKAYSIMLEYIRVRNILVRDDLAFTINTNQVNLGYKKTDNFPNQIFDLFSPYAEELIIPYNEIKKFSKNFKTQSEQNKLINTWTPLVIAILTVLLSGVFNYLIYTNDRNVYITNKNAFSDSLKISVKNELIDSTSKSSKDSVNIKVK